jgi:hypothetical protein
MGREPLGLGRPVPPAPQPMTNPSRFPNWPRHWQFEGDTIKADIAADAAENAAIDRLVSDLEADLETGILWVGRPPQRETDPRRMDQDAFLHWLAIASPDDLDRFAWQSTPFPWQAAIELIASGAFLSLALFGLWLQSWALWLSIIPAAPFLLSSRFDPPHE